MLSATVALACICWAASSTAELYSARALLNTHNKDLSSVLASIDEKLRVLDTINAVQAKQARRLDVIQDKLDRVETTLSIRLERAELAAERLEHRLHVLQSNVQTTIKESSEKVAESQMKLAELAQNLTSHIISYKRSLDKANGAYADTWHRGLVLESMMRDGLALVNATRRELADGLRALARRQRDARHNSADLEATFSRRLNDNTYKIDLKMQELLEAQKRFVDSCQRVQQDDPTHVADVLDKLIDSLINKTASTFRELQSIQVALRNHDTKVTKYLTTGRPLQNEATCKRLENVFRNASHSTFKEHELQQLTEKFVALTDRADTALQRLEARLKDDDEANELMRKLKEINSKETEDELDDRFFDESDGYFDDGSVSGDLMRADRELLSGVRRGRQAPGGPARTLHRRHPHKHPYDRGPTRKRPPA